MRKVLMISFLLMASTYAFTQAKKATAEDSVLCILDGVKRRGIPKIDTNIIAELKVYKDNDAAKKDYGNDARNGVVIINTLRYEIEAYQKKLSILCGDYKRFLAIYKNYDGMVTFYINKKIYAATGRETINKLYNLKTEDIISVKFSTLDMGNYNYNGHKNIAGMLYITTKN